MTAKQLDENHIVNRIIKAYRKTKLKPHFSNSEPLAENYTKAHPLWALAKAEDKRQKKGAINYAIREFGDGFVYGFLDGLARRKKSDLGYENYNVGYTTARRVRQALS